MSQDNFPIMDQLVQLNVRVPLRTRIRLDKYQEYMKMPPSKRLKESADWPTSLSAVVREALDEWFAQHPEDERPGVKQMPVTKPVGLKKKSAIKPKE